ncbi:MAG TPA: hypothetical protein VNA57_12080 [Acidimicrobiales bacterium]|nr:hypothetical protein [Acidimicrobiales bacterium]
MPMPTIVEVTMSEYSFSRVGQMPAGRAVFRARNRGTMPHQVILTPIPDDYPPVAELFASRTGKGLSPVAILRSLAPGERGTFAFDLAPSRYALVCLVTDAEGTSHAAKGMSREFVVPPAPTGTSRPAVKKPRQPRQPDQ